MIRGTYFDIGQIVTLDGSYTAPPVELDLPDAAQIRQEILDTLARLDIPHFDRLLATTNNLPPVVLEASNGPSMRHQGVLAPAVLGVPDA